MARKKKTYKHMIGTSRASKSAYLHQVIEGMTGVSVLDPHGALIEASTKPKTRDKKSK